MNRLKKRKEIFNKKLKKARAKLKQKSNKPRYIAKADRLESEQTEVKTEA
jgi:hypothetical protein